MNVTKKPLTSTGTGAVAAALTLVVLATAGACSGDTLRRRLPFRPSPPRRPRNRRHRPQPGRLSRHLHSRQVRSRRACLC
jgi:hypothetical protein